MNANEAIIDALQMLGILADEEPLEAATAQAAIRALNRMVSRWEVEGITLGFTTVSNLADEITVPAGAFDGIVSNLAAVLAPQFISSGPSQSVMLQAVAGKKALFLIQGPVGQAEFDANLPIGSGNEYPVIQAERFYEDEGLPLSLLVENSGETLTIAAIDTPVWINAAWSVTDSSQFDSPIDGIFRFIGKQAYCRIYASVTADIAAGSAVSCTFYFYLNGTKIQGSGTQKELTAGTPVHFSMFFAMAIRTNDRIEIFAENNDDTENIIISSAVLRIEQ